MTSNETSNGSSNETSNETSNKTLDEMFTHDLNNHDYLKICEENHNCEILQLKVKKCIFIIEYANPTGLFWSGMSICFVQSSEKHNFPICS